MTYNINDKVVLTDESIEEMNELVNNKFFTCLKGVIGEIIDIDIKDNWCLVSFPQAAAFGGEWWIDPKWIVKKEV